MNRADIVFVLDSSGSIDKQDFAHVLDFVSQLVDSFDIEGGAVRVGVLTFADNIQPAFNLSEYSSRQALKVHLYYTLYVLGTRRNPSINRENSGLPLQARSVQTMSVAQGRRSVAKTGGVQIRTPARYA